MIEEEEPKLDLAAYAEELNMIDAKSRFMSTTSDDDGEYITTSGLNTASLQIRINHEGGLKAIIWHRAFGISTPVDLNDPKAQEKIIAICEIYREEFTYALSCANETYQLLSEASDQLFYAIQSQTRVIKELSTPAKKAIKKRLKSVT